MDQEKRDRTASIVDRVLEFGLSAGLIASSFVLPNILIAFDKPMRTLYKTMDRRERERELRRIVYYMKEKGYLVGEYEHGLQLTDKAKHRLAQSTIRNLKIKALKTWDKKWRIIIYDIPVEKNDARQALQEKLRRYGCFELQRSVLITPFPCLQDIRQMAAYFDVADEVTYFEAIEIANPEPLIRRFAHKYPETKFH